MYEPTSTYGKEITVSGSRTSTEIDGLDIHFIHPAQSSFQKRLARVSDRCGSFSYKKRGEMHRA
jgi:hypothetical protein